MVTDPFGRVCWSIDDRFLPLSGREEVRQKGGRTQEVPENHLAERLVKLEEKFKKWGVGLFWWVGIFWESGHKSSWGQVFCECPP